MSLMDVAFYHGFLPGKSYYDGAFLKVQVPHGIYENEGVDKDFYKLLLEESSGA